MLPSNNIKKDKNYIKEGEIQASSKPLQSKYSTEKSQIDSPKKQIKIAESTVSMLAWCSHQNKISVIDIAAKQTGTNFDGVKLTRKNQYNSSWSHVKEISNTRLVVSVHHTSGMDSSANLAVFDVSQKGQAKKIYSFEEVSGVTGWGDVSYNPRRGILGAIPITRRIAYHLFTINPYNTRDVVKLNRKSKWPSQYDASESNWIASFDFDPSGESIATVDCYGKCLISDVSTSNYALYLKVGIADWWGRCRWSTTNGEPLLFVKNNTNKFNILDVEKKAFTLTNPIQLDRSTSFFR